MLNQRFKDTLVSNATRKLISQQDNRAAKISRILPKLREKRKEDLNKHTIKARLDLIKAYSNEDRRTHSEIIGCQDATDDPYIQDAVFDQIEDTYMEDSDALRQMLMEIDPPLSLTTNAAAPASSNQSHQTPASFLTAHLPPPNLPTFSRLYEQWDTFHDHFLPLVHNDARYGKIAFQYLKGSLIGEAAEFVAETLITENNYLGSAEVVLR